MVKLALPIALQQLLVSCAQLVDTAMVTGLGNVVVSSVGVSSRWIFLMNLFDTHIKTADEMKQRYDEPILGEIPSFVME